MRCSCLRHLQRSCDPPVALHLLAILLSYTVTSLDSLRSGPIRALHAAHVLKKGSRDYLCVGYKGVSMWLPSCRFVSPSGSSFEVGH